MGFVPPHMTTAELDGVEAVSTADAFTMARRAAREEGVWTGPSGGANLVAALRIAERLGPGHRVVTIQPDSGLKYLGGRPLRLTAVSALEGAAPPSDRPRASNSRSRSARSRATAMWSTSTPVKAMSR